MNQIYGLTHTLEGDPIIRTPRVVKIQIGNPIGKALHAYIDATGKWSIKVGMDKRDAKAEIYKFNSRAECEAAFRQAYNQAPLREFPSKLPYFTFSRSGPDMNLIPDFEVIEKHGPMPTQVPIVFTDDSPFEAAYEWWKLATGLVCKGNGLKAMRKVDAAVGLVQIEAAKVAKEAGKKEFLVEDGCYLNGCPFAGKDDKGKDRGCKPKGRLSAQLALAPRLGGKAAIDTTSPKSIVNIFSSLHELQRFTGYGDASKGVLAGIGVMMTLRKWKHEKGEAFAIGLEFRDSDYAHMRKNLLGQAAEFRRLLPAPGEPEPAPDPISNAPDPEDTVETVGEILDGTVASEHYPEVGSSADDEGDEPMPPTESAKAAEVTQTSQDQLKEKLKAATAKATKKEPEPEKPADPPVQAAAPSTPTPPVEPTPASAATQPATAPARKPFF